MKIGDFVRILSADELCEKFNCEENSKIDVGPTFTPLMWQWAGQLAIVTSTRYRNWCDLMLINGRSSDFERFVWSEDFIKETHTECHVKKFKNDIDQVLIDAVEKKYGKAPYFSLNDGTVCGKEQIEIPKFILCLFEDA